jgi:hypothetical protein
VFLHVHVHAPLEIALQWLEGQNMWYKRNQFLNGVITTGIAFFAECLRHSAKAILHSTKPLPSVTLDKYFIGKGFFADYFFSDTLQRLCRVSKKHSAKKNTRQIKNRKNLKKQQNIFLKF